MAVSPKSKSYPQPLAESSLHLRRGGERTKVSAAEPASHLPQRRYSPDKAQGPGHGHPGNTEAVQAALFKVSQRRVVCVRCAGRMPEEDAHVLLLTVNGAYSRI